jgi:hypothetical protein
MLRLVLAFSAAPVPGRIEILRSATVKFSLKKLALLPSLTLAIALIGCNNESEEAPPVDTGAPAANPTVAAPGETEATPGAATPGEVTPGEATPAETNPPALTPPAEPTTPSGDQPALEDKPAEPTDTAKPEGEAPKDEN